MTVLYHDYYSLNKVAEILGKPPQSIKIMVREGELKPSFEKEGVPFFDIHQLLKFELFEQLVHSKWVDEEKHHLNKPMTTIELFAGGGGLSLGLEMSGFKAQLLNDSSKECCDTLSLNRPDWNVVQGDIGKINFENYYNNIDMVVGGFPCQAFSHAGLQKGFDDIRGTLFFEYARAIKEVQPKFFLAENVKGLKNHDHGKTFETITNVLEGMGYTLITAEVYRCMLYKVPQKRERIILFGIRNDIKEKIISAGYKIEDLYKKPSIYPDIVTFRDVMEAGKYYKHNVSVSNSIKYPVERERFLKMVPEGGNWKNLPTDELKKEYLGGADGQSGGMTGFARRLAWDSPSLTIVCQPIQKKTERCHPTETRPLTTAESARLQTFPDSWKFSGKTAAVYKQIGNAVPVQFAAAIGRSIAAFANRLRELKLID